MEVVARGGYNAMGRGASHRLDVRPNDGSVRRLSMSLEQWGTCPVGSKAVVKEIDGRLVLASDGCIKREVSAQ